MTVLRNCFIKNEEVSPIFFLKRNRVRGVVLASLNVTLTDLGNVYITVQF